MMKFADRLLLGLVLGLLFGIGLFGLRTYQALTSLNQQSAVARYTPPAPTATALIRLAELPPSNHVHFMVAPLDSPNSDIPAAVRVVVTARPLPTIVLPTPAPQHASRILIPALGVDAPVLHGVESNSLKLGVGHYQGSVNPGERGNLVFAGHNDTYGEVFRDLIELEPDDEVIVYTTSNEYRYRIRGSRLVEPDDVGVLEPSTGATITLISCYPYLVDTQRIVVFGELVD